MSNNTPTNNYSTDKLPHFFDLLSEDDKNGYFTLKSVLSVTCGKRNRGHRVEAFGTILDEIQHYIEKGDDDDWKRSIVCGYCRMNNMIAINTRQLCFLINKCKSSINGSLQRLGYLTNPSHVESWNMFISKIPFLKNNYNELRQWTIRCKSDSVVSTPMIPVGINIIQIPPVYPYFPNICVNQSSLPNNSIAPIYPNGFIPVQMSLNNYSQAYQINFKDAPNSKKKNSRNIFKYKKY